MRLSDRQVLIYRLTGRTRWRLWSLWWMASVVIEQGPSSPGSKACVKRGLGDGLQQAEQEGERRFQDGNSQCAAQEGGKRVGLGLGLASETTMRTARCGARQYGAADSSRPGGKVAYPR